MPSNINKTIVIIIITAFIASSTTYLFFNNKESSSSPPTLTQKQNFISSQETQELETMGRQAISAFECSIYAAESNNQEEAKRLFALGYEQGKDFMKIMKQEGFLSESCLEDICDFMMQSVSEEFLLGGAYASASDKASEYINAENLSFDEEMREIIAGNKFRDSNCQLIGQ